MVLQFAPAYRLFPQLSLLQPYQSSQLLPSLSRSSVAPTHKNISSSCAMFRRPSIQRGNGTFHTSLGPYTSLADSNATPLQSRRPSLGSVAPESRRTTAQHSSQVDDLRVQLSCHIKRGSISAAETPPPSPSIPSFSSPATPADGFPGPIRSSGAGLNNFSAAMFGTSLALPYCPCSPHRSSTLLCLRLHPPIEKLFLPLCNFLICHREIGLEWQDAVPGLGQHADSEWGKLFDGAKGLHGVAVKQSNCMACAKEELTLLV